MNVIVYCVCGMWYVLCTHGRCLIGKVCRGEISVTSRCPAWLREPFERKSKGWLISRTVGKIKALPLCNFIFTTQFTHNSRYSRTPQDTQGKVHTLARTQSRSRENQVVVARLQQASIRRQIYQSVHEQIGDEFAAGVSNVCAAGAKRRFLGGHSRSSTR